MFFAKVQQFSELAYITIMQLAYITIIIVLTVTLFVSP